MKNNGNNRKEIHLETANHHDQTSLFVFFSFVYTGCVPLRQVLKEALDVREGDFYNSEEKHFQMWDSSGKIVS